MTKAFHGFGYLAALGLVVAGFMVGSTALFGVILLVLSWVPIVLWLLSPLLLLMAMLEGVVFILAMGLIREGGVAKSWNITSALQLLLVSTSSSFRIYELTYLLILGYINGMKAAKRRAVLSGAAVAYRFSLDPVQKRVSREFLGMCN